MGCWTASATKGDHGRTCRASCLRQREPRCLSHRRQQLPKEVVIRKAEDELFSLASLASADGDCASWCSTIWSLGAPPTTIDVPCAAKRRRTCGVIWAAHSIVAPRSSPSALLEVVSGRWSPGKTLTAPKGMRFNQVAALWLADIESSIDPRTFTLYQDTYVATHFAPFFETIDRLTTVGAEDYISVRLRKVTRHTVKKELSVLRRLAKWAHRRGYLEQMPEIETPGARVLGHSAESARKQTFLIFTEREMTAIIAKLPEYATSKRSGERRAIPSAFAFQDGVGIEPAACHPRQAERA